MKKTLLFLLAAISFSTAAPAWVFGQHIKQIWISPGPMTVAMLEIDGGTQVGFQMTKMGSTEMLKVAQEAIVSNLAIKAYFDKASTVVFLTGLKAPNIENVTGYDLLSLVITR